MEKTSLNQFLIGFETGAFPEESCTVPYPHEPGILESPDEYLCALANPLLHDQLELRVLRPYTAPELNNPEILYGWTDGINVFDHYKRSIHRDSCRVIGWRKLTEPVRFCKKWKDS